MCAVTVAARRQCVHGRAAQRCQIPPALQRVLLTSPALPRTTLPALPCRHALLDGVIRLSCRTDVQQDVRRALGPVPAPSLEAYSLAHELYGTTRMLLAVLGREQLEEVCQVRRESVGVWWNSEFGTCCGAVGKAG